MRSDGIGTHVSLYWRIVFDEGLVSTSSHDALGAGQDRPEWHFCVDREEDVTMAAIVVDHPEKNRFELPVEDATAVAYYRVEGNRVVMTHTEVPQHLSGRGIGSQLARGVLEAIRASGRKAVLNCPFLAGYASRHPEYADLIEG